MTSYRRVGSRPMVGSPVTGQSVHMTATAGRSPIEELLLRGGSLPDAARFGAATYFADHRAPRGDRHVRVCTGTGCFIGSRGDSLGLVESALGVAPAGVAADGSVSLQAVHCLGYCYAGPAALDGDAPRAGPDLVEQLDGRAAPTDPEVAVAAVSTPVVLRGIVSGEAPWQVWPSVVTSSEGGERVVGEVTRAGLRGRGGAGFPAAQKWVAVRQADDPGPRFVVANGDEGDPGSFADRLLMERDPGRVLEGLALAALACRATAGFVYVRSEYPRARASVERAVEAARSAGHLGVDIHGSGVAFDIEVVSGHGSYVAGEETSLLRSMAGLRGTVRVRPPYPTRHGYLGRPTAVNNVETLAAVPAILADGGAAYARLGRAPETGTLLVCLTERFARPGAYEVELGTPLRAIVEERSGPSKATAVRYERARPGELVHMDVKKIGRIPDGGGWRAHGRAPNVNLASGSTAAGFDYVHSLVDDHSRLAYSEILADEKGTTCAGFLVRAIGLLRRPRRHPDRRADDGQRLVLQVVPAGRVCRTRHPPDLHPAPLPLAERQGRTTQPHPADRMGLSAGLHHQRRPRRSPCALARALQHSTPPQRTRGLPPPLLARRRAQGRSRAPGPAGGWSARRLPGAIAARPAPAGVRARGGRSVARARQPGGDRQQCLSRRPARPRVAVRCRRELRRLYAVPRGHPPRGLRPGAHQRGRRPARPDG